MRKETRTFTQTLIYNVFEPGERVRIVKGYPRGSRSVWVVERFLPPHEAGDEAVVFLEGYPYGVNAARLGPAEEGE